MRIALHQPVGKLHAPGASGGRRILTSTISGCQVRTGQRQSLARRTDATGRDEAESRRLPSDVDEKPAEHDTEHVHAPGPPEPRARRRVQQHREDRRGAGPSSGRHVMSNRPGVRDPPLPHVTKGTRVDGPTAPGKCINPETPGSPDSLRKGWISLRPSAMLLEESTGT